jgi:dTDP-4-amino-4,6-dideoxygalactose transaminase
VATLSNGTQALSLALKAAAGTGGLCAMPAWTFAATAHAAVQAGLTPWFLDVDPETWMLDVDQVRAALAAAPGPVAAVVPVAAFGRVPDLEAWAAFRRDTGVPVVLDAAAAFDSLCDAAIPAAVSLHATKVLGVGEGGFLASDDPALIDKVRQLSAFGFRGSREAQVMATNAKLSEYAAAVGHASLDGWPSARLRLLLAAQKLRSALAFVPEVVFQPGWGLDWVSSVCVVALPEGAAGQVAARLAAYGVDTRRWWGEGCQAMPAFQDLPRQPLTVTARLAGSTLGLPFAINLEADEIGRIAEALTGAVAAL